MVKFQSHLDELDIIKEAIEKYKTGNESQAYWANKYNISLSIFRYYYNKKGVRDITRRKEKSTSDDEHIVHESKRKPSTRKGSKQDDFINGDPLLKKAIQERYGHQTIDVDSPNDQVSMKQKEIKRASSFDTRHGERHFEKLEPLENKRKTRKSNIDYREFFDPDGQFSYKEAKKRI
ncbi:MAG: hypothetical protein Hyperionvirus29_15 [Hyperionvirus sp.]|uniref:Uncharacterized protein n=1 Tax=Hyperionvirus sp. TaxID=2487770 RepID=A0A3G5ABP2_9VIRU|nr:MAG: hypothetical protein Hyperionvirus29_15 [Hyperionvirus sp.]